MMKHISIFIDNVDVIDRFGCFLFNMIYDDFMHSKYRLLDYKLCVYDSGVKIKILKPIVE